MEKSKSNWPGGDDLVRILKSPQGLWSLLGWGGLWAITGFDGTLFIIFGLCALGTAGVFDWGKGVDEGKRKRRRGGEQEGPLQPVPQTQIDDIAPAPLMQKAVHDTVIEGATPARTRLEAAAAVATGERGERLRRMVANVRKVADGLKADPSKLNDVQRLFTYYLPATSDLLAAVGAVTASGDTARAAEIDAMIGKLDEAYGDFAERIDGHDARSLAIDLRMLEQSLDQEFDSKKTR
jgi:hypothetical protein